MDLKDLYSTQARPVGFAAVFAILAFMQQGGNITDLKTLATVAVSGAISYLLVRVNPNAGKSQPLLVPTARGEERAGPLNLTEQDPTTD